MSASPRITTSKSWPRLPKRSMRTRLRTANGCTADYPISQRLDFSSTQLQPSMRRRPPTTMPPLQQPILSTMPSRALASLRARWSRLRMKPWQVARIGTLVQWSTTASKSPSRTQMRSQRSTSMLSSRARKQRTLRSPSLYPRLTLTCVRSSKSSCLMSRLSRTWSGCRTSLRMRTTRF